MPLVREHEIHGRRMGRNMGVALSLIGLVALIFALTVVKIGRGDNMEAFDHTVRPALADQN